MKKSIFIIRFIIILALGSCSEKNSDSSFSAINSNDGSITGKGGSLARFCIAENYLYVVDESNLYTYTLANPAKPVKTSETKMGFGIETIFYYQGHLYIGSNNGMIICTIANPANPTVLSTYSHITSCDPVVVQGNYAYVTLRTGTTCNRGLNQLEVINISDKNNPTLVKIIQMTNPWGLGIDGKHLFVCENAEDISYYDITVEANPVFKKKFEDIFAFDIIPENNLLITTGKEGIKQYDYSKLPNSLDLLSKIEIGK